MKTFKEEVLLEYTKIALTHRFDSYYVAGATSEQILEEILSDAVILHNMIEEKIKEDGKDRQPKKSNNTAG